MPDGHRPLFGETQEKAVNHRRCSTLKKRWTPVDAQKDVAPSPVDSLWSGLHMFLFDKVFHQLLAYIFIHIGLDQLSGSRNSDIHHL